MDDFERLPNGVSAVADEHGWQARCECRWRAPGWHNTSAPATREAREHAVSSPFGCEFQPDL